MKRWTLLKPIGRSLKQLVEMGKMGKMGKPSNEEVLWGVARVSEECRKSVKASEER